MKKSLRELSLLLAIVLFVISMTSCISIPKKVKNDTSLIIMTLSFNASGYEYVEGKKTNVEVNIVDTKTMKKYKAYTNKDNLVVFTVPANTYYKITQVKYTGPANEALWVDINDWPMMKANPETILNMGYWKFDFDGKKNWCNWNRLDFHSTEVSFLDAAEESEWVEKPIERMK